VDRIATARKADAAKIATARRLLRKRVVSYCKAARTSRKCKLELRL